MADILLEVGISIASLKSARAQIGAELKSWKFPETEKAQILDKKQIEEAKKSVKDFGKTVAVSASQAYAPIEDVGKATGFSSASLKKLAETSKFYNLQAETQGRTLSIARAELSAYNRALSSGAVSIEQVGHKVGKLTEENKKLAAEHEKSMQQGLLSPKSLSRMALWGIGWSAMYGAMRLVTDTISELISGLVATSEILEKVSISQLSFEEKIKRMPEAAKKYHPIRAMIVGLESDLLKASKTTKEATPFWEGFFAAGRTGALQFSHMQEAIKKTDPTVSAISESMKTWNIRAKDAASAFAIFRYETLSEKEALEGLNVAGYLFNLTGEQIELTASVVAETYKMWGDTLTDLTTSTEKFAYIQQFLDKLFTQSHVTIKEYAQIMAYAALGADKNAVSLETLGDLISFADDKMKSGRRSGILLADTLLKLTEDSGKLTQELGITFDPTKPLFLEDIILKLRDAFKEVRDERVKDFELSKIASGETLVFLKEVLKNEELLAKLDENRKNRVRIEREISGELAFDTQKQIALSEREMEIKKLSALGLSEQVLSYNRIYAEVEKIAWASRDETKRHEIINELLALRNADYQTITEASRRLGIDEKTIQEYILALTKERSAIAIKMYEEIKSLADEIESKTVDFVKNMMMGTANAKEFMQSIVDAYRSAFAEQLGEMLASTGIFTGMAEAFLSPMQKARKSLYDAIVEGCRDGASALRAGVSGAEIPGAAGAAGARISPFDKLWVSIQDLLGVTKTQTDTSKKSSEATNKLTQAFSVVSQAAGIGAGLYAGYQGVMAQKGQGPVMGALGGAMSGAQMGAMFGPYGMAIGAVAGGILGVILGSKKQKIPDEVKMQTIELKSAIQISNRELSLVNRNLEGIRHGIEGAFIMPRTAYFAVSHIEERFALDALRGKL